MNVEKKYAVILCRYDTESICSIYNAALDAWMPAIFSNEYIADKFLETISNAKAYENNFYTVRELVCVWSTYG